MVIEKKDENPDMTKPRIKMSPFGQSFNLNPDHRIEAQYDWAEDTFLQGGDSGLVITRDPDKPHYTTAFVEVMPTDANGGGFFRGEGKTVAEAETAAWEKFQRSRRCEKHEWETRGYKNGAGFCKNCNHFESGVFTAAELGQFCATCRIPTLWGQSLDSEGENQWYCESHMLAAKTIRYRIVLEAEKNNSLTEEEKRELSLIRSMYRTDNDGTLAEYTYDF